MNKNISTPVGIIIIVVIAIFVIGVVAWQSGWIEQFVGAPTLTPTPSPDETAGWKTYKNEKYGFEIKYPNGTKIFTATDSLIYGFPSGDDIVFEISFPERADFIVSSGADEGAYISGISKEFIISPEEVELNYKGIEEYATSTFSKCFPGDSIIINGTNFVKNEISSDFLASRARAMAFEYCTMKNGKRFKLFSKLLWSNDNDSLADIPTELREKILRDAPSTTLDQEAEILKQMLSTFKFVE